MRSIIAAFGLLSAVLVANAAAEEPCDVEGNKEVPEWRTRCDAAIKDEKNPKRLAMLLFGRAYLAVENYRYAPALEDLDAAVAADPDCIRCRHERAYLNAEFGNYSQAIADLDYEIKLMPKSSSAYTERAFARTFSGDLAGGYQDRARVLELEPDSIDALLGRSDAALWLGKFEEATADAAQAQAFAKEAVDDKAQERARKSLEEIKLWRTTSRGPKAAERCVVKSLEATDSKILIGDCTRAFLEANDPAAKANALTTRSTAWTVLANSPDNAALDMRVAAGLDPGNHERYINLGYAYLGTSHSWAAKREFERALALQRSPLALVGRAVARMHLDDAKGAESDALESMKLEPTMGAAYVLAHLAFDAGNKDRAREMYLVAYRMGSRSDLLFARLKELGVADPAAVKAP